MKTILSHANLIDCVEPKVRPDTAVLIEDGRIRAILPSGEAGSAGDARVIDLKGGYLMPGLWDVHIHPDYLSLDEMPLADQVTLFGQRLAAALTESGIVGLRCAGAHHFMDLASNATLLRHFTALAVRTAERLKAAPGGGELRRFHARSR